MTSLPNELTLPEVAHLLCHEPCNGPVKSACANLMLKFLVRAVTPFFPRRIGDKHDLVAFYRDEPKGYWEKLNEELDRAPQRGRSKTNHGASVTNAHKIVVGRDYFLHFIDRTPGRYPRIKEHYAKNPFWGRPEKMARGDKAPRTKK